MSYVFNSGISNLTSVNFWYWATWPLLPVLAAQGVWTRRRTPRLPDAAGPQSGFAGSSLSLLSPSSLNLVVLGESTVAGIGAPDHETALTGQAARALSQHTGRPVNWHAVGLSGATAATARAQLLPRLAGLRADVCIVALGVNDVIKLRSPARWQRDLTALLNGVRAVLGPVPLILASAPPLEKFPALPEPLRTVFGARAARLNRVGAGLSAALPQVVCVPFSRLPAPDEFAPDGFHPGPAAYAVWGAQLGAEAAKIYCQWAQSEHG